MQKKVIYNPYLPTFEYIPDGEPHVFDGRIYLYGSHDRFHGADFCLNDYVSYSADVHDLTDWRYEGVIFRKDQDPRNQKPANLPKRVSKQALEPIRPEDLNPEGVHAMWAPDVVRGLDGRYYLYYCLDVLPEIGVAVCDSPAGRYEFLGFVRHADGTLLGQGEGDLIQFDPGIFIDDDKKIYLYSGNATRDRKFSDGKHASQVMQLEEDMLTLKTEPKKLLPDVTESEGTGYEGHEFFEASSIRKINGAYYFVYSSVQSHELCYAVSDRPDEGYRFGGTLVDIGDVFKDGREEKDAVNCLGNTHGGIERAGDRWFVFYHRQTNRTNYSRQACAEEIFFDEDGRIRQAEVTSRGLNDGPLPAVGSYPASACCHLTAKNGAVLSIPSAMKTDYPYLTQDGPDLEPMPERTEEDRKIPVQYVANLQDGSTVGYKYFRFDGVRQITLEVRGEAKGEIELRTDREGACLGRISVDVSSREWTMVSLPAKIPDGVSGLYLTYGGAGKLDMRRMIFS